MTGRYFGCLYFDGITSKAHPGKAVCLPGGLSVEYLDEGGQHRTETWEGKGIRLERSAGGGSTRLLYGSFPHASITVTDPDFLPEFRLGVPEPTPAGPVYAFFMKNAYTLGAAAVLVLGLLAGTWIFLIPGLADAAAMAVPPAQEKSLGRALFSSLEDRLALDVPAGERLGEFAARLRFEGPEPEVHVSPEDVVNAFAVMGGFIVVYRPMLELIETPDQLAALLAHEYAHIRKRHSARLLFRALSGYAAASLLLNDFSGIAAALLQYGDRLMTMNYSRAFEREADAEAVRILEANGYPGAALAELFELIERSGADDAPEWLSTHPLLVSRIREARTRSGTFSPGSPDEELLAAFSRLREPDGQADSPPGQ